LASFHITGWTTSRTGGPLIVEPGSTARNAFWRYHQEILASSQMRGLTTPKQVAQWHAGLPCSGKIVSIKVRGRYATAVFRLGNRKTSKCDAPGTLAAARFTIVRGKITVWQQVPPPSQGPVA